VPQFKILMPHVCFLTGNICLSTRAKNENMHFSTTPSVIHLAKWGNIMLSLRFPPKNITPFNLIIAANDMMARFCNITMGLMVGIGGGVPSKEHDIRLGDIVVSMPDRTHGGILQCDIDESIKNQRFQAVGSINNPPSKLASAVHVLDFKYKLMGHWLGNDVNVVFWKNPSPGLQKYKRPDPSSDRLYQTEIIHPSNNGASCAEACGDDPSKLILRPKRNRYPMVHHGLIASANRLIDDASIRDKLAEDQDVLCFRMGNATLADNFPCLFICGICDYSDSHKNEEWKGFAAMTAAAYAKDLLGRLGRRLWD
jgi:nucleoside phosphorylase